MITFKSNDHIDETKLDKEEAIDFISFLLRERLRHIKAQNISDGYRFFYHKTPVLVVAYESSVGEHLKDIQYIDKTVKYLKEKWGDENVQSK